MIRPRVVLWLRQPRTASIVPIHHPLRTQFKNAVFLQLSRSYAPAGRPKGAVAKSSPDKPSLTKAEKAAIAKQKKQAAELKAKKKQAADKLKQKAAAEKAKAAKNKEMVAAKKEKAAAKKEKAAAKKREAAEKAAATKVRVAKSAAAKKAKDAANKARDAARKAKAQKDERSKAKAEALRQLQKDALEPPRVVPRTGRTEFIQDLAKREPDVFKLPSGGSPATRGAARFTALSERWNAEPQSEKERWDAQARSTRAAEKEQYRKWVETQNTADLVRANHAREMLRKFHPELKTKYPAIVSQDRDVKRIPSAYALFVKDNFAEKKAGRDLSKEEVRVIMSTLGPSWKVLPEGDKQKYRVKFEELRTAREARLAN